MPYHKMLDELYETAKGKEATETTRRGIGPAFADKASYNGLRWIDFKDKKLFVDKLKMQLRLKNKIMVALGGKPLAFKKVYEEYLSYYNCLSDYIQELYPLIQKALSSKKSFLLEQAQGILLDPDWGIYPFVTGSTTLASAVTAGLGIPPRAISNMIGVTKAYTTRVGGGPFPTEVEKGSRAANFLQEIAATTGRIRRVGWFDAELVRLSIQLNGIDQLFLTKLDRLSEFDTLKICTGYKLGQKKVSYIEVSPDQWQNIKPLYETVPGWRVDISHIRTFEDLPRPAKHYVKTIEKILSCPIRWISVGPEREALIIP